MKILIIEDEVHLAEGLRFNLEADGHDAVIAETGELGLEKASEGGLAVIILDVMLPGIDGFEVARKLRDRGDYTPILMLTALGRPEDVIKGFEAGTDDYLPKPFDLSVFMARINGLIRRAAWAKIPAPSPVPSDVTEVNGRRIDFQNLELASGNEVVRLTLMEIKLLRFLIENEGRVVSRKQILEDVWGLQEDTDTRAIDNFIVRLRKYLEDEPNDPKILKTVRGIGYRFDRV
ncbi:MAG: response regulator transcription factor [Pyrinomonadaceae bacterium]|nr:response regulator transcription factor [Blastocatellia bacterium]MCW5956195.1 response regulator transcription factor [Pyrinomonadaceae bacterium]